MFTEHGGTTMGEDEAEEEPIVEEPDDDLRRAILEAKINCGCENERLKLSHQKWPDEDRHRAHQQWALLQLRLPHCSTTVFSEHMIVVIILFFFIVFHYNPSFSVLGPTSIAGHETGLNQVDVKNS